MTDAVVKGPFPQAEKPERPRISEELLWAARQAAGPSIRELTLPKFPPGTAPSGVKIAMDEGLRGNFDYLQAGVMNMMGDPTRVQGVGFPGFPYLSSLAQVPEYRRISEIYAEESTRKWVELQASGDQDKTEKIKKLNDALERYKVQELFHKMSMYDGLYGRGHLFLDFGKAAEDELDKPIGDGRDALSRMKISLGSLKSIRAVEPMWVMPNQYESQNPLAEDFYKPRTWFVQGKTVHTTRLLTFVAREVPDIFKPAYAFSGMAWSEMINPYVQRWQRTAKAVSDLIHSFSVSVLKTNMSGVMLTGSAELLKRLQLFADFRDNKSVFAIDNDPTAPEEFSNVSTSLGGLDHLQAQSQEHVCSISGVPILLYTGISPSGLNATAQPELDCWHIRINAYQNRFFSPNFQIVLDVIQLSEFGEVDPDITFAWNPLSEPSALEKEELQNKRAQTGEVLLRSGVISRAEERQRVAADEDAPYDSLDLSKPAPLLPNEKAQMAVAVTTALGNVQQMGILPEQNLLQELKNASLTVGLFSSIDDEMIANADATVPEPDMGELMEGVPGGPGSPEGGPKPPGGGISPGGKPNAPGGAPPGFPVAQTRH